MTETGVSRYELTLFVSGASDLSARAIANATDAVRRRTWAAAIALVSSTCTRTRGAALSNRRPGDADAGHAPAAPVRRVVGDLSDTDRSSCAGARGCPAPRIAAVEPIAPTDSDDALARMAEAEDTLRAIGAGEVDAFVVSDGGPTPARVHARPPRTGPTGCSSRTCATAPRRSRRTASSCTPTDGWRSCCRARAETIVGARWRRFISGGSDRDGRDPRPGGRRHLELDLSTPTAARPRPRRQLAARASTATSSRASRSPI